MNLVVFIYSELNYRTKIGYSMFASGSGVFKLLVKFCFTVSPCNDTLYCTYIIPRPTLLYWTLIYFYYSVGQASTFLN